MEIDLTALKSSINKRKEEILNEDTVMGIRHRKPVASDSVLHELIESVNTGKETNTVKKIKQIDNLAAQKKGSVGKTGAGLTEALSGHMSTGSPETPPQMPQQPPQQMNERDDAFEKRLNNSSQTLASEMSRYVHQPQYQPQYQPQQPTNPMYQQPQQVINEQINRGINEFINENFSDVVQEAMKSTIIEMYSLDRMKKILTENKDILRGMVRDIVIEIANNNKKKS